MKWRPETYSYHEDEGPYGIGAVNLARIRD
jgi:hypothetical protein